MMGEAKISVIVPVFNAEKYIDQCIVSIINQTLGEIEIIIINDGSTDTSKEIIVGHCEKDPRIVFIDSENKGVSAARNAGIKMAKGEFIGFVDADDYLAPGMYEALYKKAKQYNAELAICNAFTIEDKKPLATRLQLDNEVLAISDAGTFVNDWLRFKFDYSNWNKIYATGIIRGNNILFNEKLFMWEDILFNLVYSKYVKLAVTIKECLYFYRVHAASIMGSSKNLFSEQYNLFFETYSSFCIAHSLEGPLAVFQRNRAGSCVPNIFRLVQPASGTSVRFLALLARFTIELKELNPDIYLFKEKGNYPEKNGQWLLQKRWISLFAFFYLSDYTIRKKLRKMIKG